MRKIPSNLDNPFDNIIINFCENTVSYLKQLNFTPNILTSISLLLGVFSVVLFCYDYYKLSAIIFLISYIFDCYDGHFARKYNMTTKFGCYYDHISDMLKLLLFFVAIYFKSKEKFFLIIPILIVLFILNLIHVGCVEKYTFQEVQSQSLSYFQPLCPGNPEILLNYTRFFSSGTFVIVFVIFIFTFNLY
jgi:phosphatidylglycerophosphate synthase